MSTSVDDRDFEARTRALPLVAPPDAVYERLRATLAAETPAPKPARSPWARRLWLLLPPLVAVLLIAADGILRSRGFWRHDADTVQRVCLPSAIAALGVAVWTTIMATSHGRHGLGERVGVLRSIALSVAPLSLVPILLLAGFGSANADNPPGEALHPWGVPCFVLAIAIAAGSLLVLAVRFRRTVVVAAGWRAAALSAAAASWSGLALLVHCSSVDLQHLLAGHFLPILLFPMLGALVAYRTLKL